MSDRVGFLRHRVTVQRAVSLADGGGGYDLGWADIGALWARVTPLRGRQQVSAMRPHALVSYQVTIRFGADVRGSDRLIYRGRMLRIDSIVNRDDADDLLDILCSEEILE